MHYRCPMLMEADNNNSIKYVMVIYIYIYNKNDINNNNIVLRAIFTYIRYIARENRF